MSLSYLKYHFLIFYCVFVDVIKIAPSQSNVQRLIRSSTAGHLLGGFVLAAPLPPLNKRSQNTR